MFPAARVSAPASPALHCSDQWLPRLLAFILTPTTAQNNQPVPVSGSHQDVILKLIMHTDVDIIDHFTYVVSKSKSQECIYSQQETQEEALK